MRGSLANWAEYCGVLAAAMALSALLSTGPAIAEKRIALVVGNSAYQNVPRLDNPRNDAVLMAERFRVSASAWSANMPSSIWTSRRWTTPCRTSDGRSKAPMSHCSITLATASRSSGSNYLVPINANPRARPMSISRWSTSTW